MNAEDGVKRQVPGRIPRIFPFVGYRNDVLIHHVVPIAIAHGSPAALHRIVTVLLEP
jgi:hypothetical protein